MIRKWISKTCLTWATSIGLPIPYTLYNLENTFFEFRFTSFFPNEDAGGFKSRIRPPYPQPVVKGD